MAELERIVKEESKVLYSFNETSVIPALNFTRPGTILSWTFAARRVLGMNISALPSIQIWRPVNRNGHIGFRLNDSREVHVNEDSEDLMVSFELETKMMVEAGDVVGVNQPENSELLILFGEGGYLNYIVSPGQERFSSHKAKHERRLPLLIPEFHPSGECIIVSTMTFLISSVSETTGFRSSQSHPGPSPRYV